MAIRWQLAAGVLEKANQSPLVKQNAAENYQKVDVSIVELTTPSGNRTRVSPVAGAYSTTRPTVLKAVSPSRLRCRIELFQQIIYL